jgi:hypothetical protein
MHPDYMRDYLMQIRQSNKYIINENNKYIDNKEILNLNNINDLNIAQLRKCVSYYHYKEILDHENLHHLYDAHDLEFDYITDYIKKMHPDYMRDYLMQIRKSNKYILDINEQ